MFHIKIGEKSWCNTSIGAEGDDALSSHARRHGYAPICQHENRSSADDMVAFLKSIGVYAKVVDGPCDQRDEPYFGEE